jgi:hypothetical protein
MLVVKPQLATGKANSIHTRKFIGQSSDMVPRDISKTLVMAPRSAITVEDVLRISKKIAFTEVDHEDEQKMAFLQLQIFHELNTLFNGSQHLFGPYFRSKESQWEDRTNSRKNVANYTKRVSKNVAHVVWTIFRHHRIVNNVKALNIEEFMLYIIYLDDRKQLQLDYEASTVEGWRDTIGLRGWWKTTFSPFIMPVISLTINDHYYLTMMKLACADPTTAGWIGSWKTMPTALSATKTRYIDYTRPPQLEHISASTEKKSCRYYANGECKFGDNCRYNYDKETRREPKRQKICASDFDPDIDIAAYNRMIDAATYSDDEINTPTPEDK